MAIRPYPQRILVTGGAGFIGSATVKQLLADDIEVIVLDNLFSGKLTNLDLSHPNIEFIEGDILELPFVIELVARCDAVLHLAAVTSVPLSIEDPLYAFQVNSQGFLHVLEAVRQCSHPVRFVYASSAAIYGDTEQLPCRDDDVITQLPLSPYALQKLQNEHYATLYTKLYGLSSLGLRYFNVYGKHQDLKSPYSGVITKFIASYQADEPLVVYGNGLQSRDFIYVDDVVRANVLALTNDAAGVMNIGCGKPENLMQVIQALETIGQRKAKTEFAPVRIGDVKNSYADVHKAKKELQFSAEVTLLEGLKRMF